MILRVCKHLLLSAAVMIGVAVMPLQAVAAPSLALSEFALETHDNFLTIHASLALTEQQDVLESLHNGVQLQLNIGILVNCKQPWYSMNDDLIEVDRSFFIRYDPLIRAYILAQGKEQHQFKTLDSLLHSAWESIPLRIKLDAPLKRGETYSVTINADLQQTDISPWLKKVLFFKSWEVSPALSITQEVCF